MPFGFGFNKAKVLASAEKNVKAGKLQHAIADYEKIVKEDPKDLTILNTIGDLYARLGRTEQATKYYKQVGDAFAGNGFTVKAIAMYKKITKLDSSVESLNRLAELYAQQGLHSDARSQYALVAEYHLKNGALDKAATVFQKVLDLDPENAVMQAKLAELYVRLGKKNEARDIYLRNAELYRSRKNFQAADDSLGQLLAIDKTFSQAILLRGLVKMELGDAAGAVQCLEQVPDIDSRPEGLRSMLKAYFKLDNLEAAGPLARKLYTVFHETQALISYAEALTSADRIEDALGFYTEFSDVMFAAQGEAVVQSLQGCIGKLKHNPAALEQLAGLLQRAGQTTDLAEIKELVAHASVQSGDLAKARDLYRELARLEPDNPLHTQNYRQVLAKLGEDSSARELTAEEAAQPMLVDELEGTLPEIPNDYAPEVAEALRAALTEAELFDSYNLPAKAIAPLEAVLARAPQDAQVNQRLASLYARTSRFEAAATRCRVLDGVYQQAGFPEKAHEYAELATKYAGRAGASVTTPSAADIPAEIPHKVGKEPLAPPAFAIEEPAQPAPAGSVAEFEFTPAAALDVAPGAGAPVQAELHAAESPAFDAQPEAPVMHAAADVSAPAVPSPGIFGPLPAASDQPGPTSEFDLSSEWEDLVEVEIEREAAPAVSSEEITPDPLLQQPWLPPSTAAAPEDEVLPGAELRLKDNGEAHKPTPDFATESVVPSGEMVDGPAQSVHALSFEQPPANVDAAIFEMLGTKPEAGYPERVSDVIEEIRFYASQGMWEEAQRALAALEHEAPEAAANLRAEIAQPATSADAASEVFGIAAANEIELIEEPVSATDELEAESPSTPSATFEEELSPLPIAEVIEETPLAWTAPAETAAGLPVTEAATTAEPDSVDTMLGLDAVLGADFEIGPQPAATLTPAPPQPAPAQTMSAAAGSVGHAYSVLAPQASAAPVSAPAVVTPPAPPPPVAVTATERAAEATSLTESDLDFSDGALADIFAEFKNDMESGSTQGEDPETHYNLGVAFKEMGLLDEAIGELQKVCQAIDRGQSFPQVLQTYTWLANCFVQKGVPEAGIRWYEKALRSPHLEGETATAIHYELACACEQAGNRSDALAHFMEVYGANIDYRDVAERIKALKS